jgi:hypothetical protein
MTRKTKGRTGCRAAQKTTHADHTPHHLNLKAIIVNLALWGLIPARLADWLIQRGGLRHE